MLALIVEDDIRQRALLARVLSDAGHETSEAGSLEQARKHLRERRHEVLLLDRILPDGDGIVLCEELRHAGDSTPILMLTARGDVADRVTGLRAGADDYLMKPFEIDELLARMEALSRRAVEPPVSRIVDLELDRVRREVRVAGVLIALTAREYTLVAYLAEHKGEALSRIDLFTRVWGLVADPGTGVLEVHVSRLREKLGDRKDIIETVRGVGYRLKSGS